MRRVYPKRRPNPPLKTDGTRGFSLGLNQQAHPTTIRNNELVEAQNVIYSQYGTVSKRPGSANIGAPRGNSTIIRSMGGVYEIGGTPADYLLRISNDGILQKYDFGTGTWVDVSGSPTFSNVDTTILQAYGKVYLLNPTDTMRKWDGTSFTTFTALANPSSAPTIAKVGMGTGAVTYYYKYVWYNDVGNTIASAEVSLANMPETLDASTYAQITLPAAPAGTVKTGIFRSTVTNQEVYYDSVPAAQTTYNDKGFGKLDPLYAAPTSNTTSGFHFYFATVYNNTLIGVTTELGKHTLVFSGGGDKFDSFGRSDGGGYYAWRKDDGDPITGVHAFQEELYVFKRKKVGAFKFDEGGGAVRDINLALGGVSHRSIHAAGNDLRFWSDQGAMQLGNQPNFADLIRVQVMSAKAQTTVDSITSSDFNRISGVYYKNLSIWGIPLGASGKGNTSALVFDDRYLAWSEWTGITPNVWTKFIKDGVERLFFGDSQSGNVVECWKGKNDRGTPINFRVATKQFDMGAPYQYKRFKKTYLIFNNVTGDNTKITFIEDGQPITFSAPLYAAQGNQGFGVDQWGTMQFGESSGSVSNDTSGLLIRYYDMENKDLFSMQTIVTNDGLNDDIEFMALYIEYAQSTKQLPTSFRLIRDQTTTQTVEPVDVPASVPRGVNLSGLEFGGVYPGALGTNYFDSVQATYNYFGITKRFNTVRLPFAWERLQIDLNGNFEADYLSTLDAEVTKAANAGMKVILDLHNYGRRNIVAPGGFTSDFASSDPMWSGGTVSGGKLSITQFQRALGGSRQNPKSPAASYKLTADVTITANGGGDVWRSLWVELYRKDDNNRYFFTMNNITGQWQLYKTVAGVQTLLASGSATFTLNQAYTLEFDVDQTAAGKVTVVVDSIQLAQVNKDAALTGGYVALFGNGVDGSIDNVTLDVAGDTSSAMADSGYFRIGDSQLPISAYVDVWTKLADHFKNNINVYAYDLMNEPHDMPTPTSPSNYLTTSTWTQAAQAAINAIRTLDTDHYIIAELDAWAGGQSFVSSYGSNPTPWLQDDANKLVYSFHYYFDPDHSGSYSSSYTPSALNRIETEVVPLMQWAQTRNLRLHCGEYGTPNDDESWLTAMTAFLEYCNTYNVWANHWAAGDAYSAVTTLQPTNSYTTDRPQMQVVGKTRYLGTLI